ncbi:MAG: DUF63 family protein [Candidatus Thermoplasmatota archaeon]
MWGKAFIHQHALSICLGVILLGTAIVAVGVVLAPSIFYDHFVWQHLYGPLALDTHQCRSSAEAACAGLGPAGVIATDGFTFVGLLVFGVVLALLLYGLYAGIVKEHGLAADGWFLTALLPWIFFGATARVLEDANVFCRPGTNCDPSPIAYAFVTPVIYVQVAAYVIAAMLLGVLLQKRRLDNARRLTGIASAALVAGLLAYAGIVMTWGAGISAFPPVWCVALAVVLAIGVFHWRATRGLASVNVTLFALGIPFAAGSLYLIARWLSGDVWAPQAWNGRLFVPAAIFILVTASLVAAGVYAFARYAGKAAWPARHGLAALRVPQSVARALGATGGVALALALVVSTGFSGLASAGRLAPALALLGLVLLGVFALLHVGKTAVKRPEVFLIYALALSVALVFAHVVDGFATWFAHDDPFGFGIPPYSEKHPVGDVLLGFWGGFPFLAAKLVMTFVVVWLLAREAGAGSGTIEWGEQTVPRSRARWADGSMTATTTRTTSIAGLVMISIFVIGMAPGLRDVLRIAMGV